MADDNRIVSIKTTHLTMPPDMETGPLRLEWFYQNAFPVLPRHHPAVDSNLADYGSSFCKGKFCVIVAVYADGRKETKLVEDGPLDSLTFKMTEWPDGFKRFESLADGLCHSFNEPSRITWHPNGVLASEVCCVAGRIHAEGIPAVVEYYEDGTKKFEGWKRHGIYTRDGEPAWIAYRPDGTVRKQK